MAAVAAARALRIAPGWAVRQLTKANA